MKKLNELYTADRDDWRAWLRKNYEVEREVWLIYYKVHTNKTSIPYADSVEEALCFGWIDSTIKRIDDEKYARKFTPRTTKSRWSELNKKRARKMIKQGRMTEAGLTKIEEAKRSGEWFKTAIRITKLVIPEYVKKEIEKNQKALTNFNSLSKSNKKRYVGWITSAKRKETREQRLAEAIKLLSKNEPLGMK